MHLYASEQRLIQYDIRFLNCRILYFKPLKFSDNRRKEKFGIRILRLGARQETKTKKIDI